MPPLRRIRDLAVDSLVIGETEVVTAVLLASEQAVDINGEADGLILDADADTTISSPTDDQIDFELKSVDHVVMKAAAVANAGATTNIVEIIATTPVDTTGTNVHNALNIDVEIGNASGGTNTARALYIDPITGDAQVTAVAIEVGSGWGTGLKTDTIGETTSAAGVTIDGTLIKDGRTDAGRVVQALTASGAITINSGLVTLNHATVIIEATLDAPTTGDELFIIDASGSGTAAHTVTAGAGVTFDGTNNTATLNAPGEALHIVAISATRWFIMENIGEVALSNV
jgi:hypothetical protein